MDVVVAFLLSVVLGFLVASAAALMFLWSGVADITFWQAFLVGLGITIASKF